MTHGRGLFAAIALAALLAGTGLWWATRPAEEVATISTAALFGASFSDTHGATHSLGEFQGQVVVLNFWATWCAPCREEMPAFERLHERWKARGVRFVGLSDEEPAAVESFASRLRVQYPLWVGGDTREVSRRLGNRLAVLPYTVVFDRAGTVAATKVGAYSESALEALIGGLAAAKP